MFKDEVRNDISYKLNKISRLFEESKPLDLIFKHPEIGSYRDKFREHIWNTKVAHYPRNPFEPGREGRNLSRAIVSRSLTRQRNHTRAVQPVEIRGTVYRMNH